MLFDSVRLAPPRPPARERLLTRSCSPPPQICNSQWFVKTSMILFLNKDDVRPALPLLSSGREVAR